MLTIADISHVKAVSGGWVSQHDGFLLKATQGTGFADPAYPARIAALRAAGRLRGSYHYAGPSPNPAGGAPAPPPGDPVAEADWYLAHVDHRDGETMWLDFEPQTPPADRDGWCAAFCQRVADRTGVIPGVYLSELGMLPHSSWAKTRAVGAHLWVARYFANTGNVPPQRPANAPWASWAGWQYTSNGTVPGISGPVDLSLFDMTADEWTALGTAGGDMPTAEDIAAAVWNHPVAARGGYGGNDGQSAVAWAWLRDGRVDIGQALAQLADTDPTKHSLNADVRADLANAVKQRQQILDLLSGIQPPQQDPAALAQAIVAALPAQDAEKTAEAILTSLGQKLAAPAAS